MTIDRSLSRRLAIIIADRSFERAHHAFVLAAGGLALGRDVMIFGGGLGVQALCRDWTILDGHTLDSQFQSKGVAGFDTLRSAVFDLGGTLLACEAGLRSAALELSALYPGVRSCGVTHFLERSADAQIISL